MSPGSLPSVPAARLSMQLCPPAFTTVQGGSEFHFVNMGTLRECVCVLAMRMLPCRASEGTPRLPSGGSPLRILIDSELALPRTSAERIGPLGRSAVRVAFRIPGRRAAAGSPSARSGFRSLRRSGRIAQEPIPGLWIAFRLRRAVHRFRAAAWTGERMAVSVVSSGRRAR